jgi:hypothetical protein
MLEPRDLRDRPNVFARAEPDDEYDNPRPEPLDPYLIDQDEDDEDVNDEEEMDEDEL